MPISSQRGAKVRARRGTDVQVRTVVRVTRNGDSLTSALKTLVAVNTLPSAARTPVCSVSSVRCCEARKSLIYTHRSSTEDAGGDEEYGLDLHDDVAIRGWEPFSPLVTAGIYPHSNPSRFIHPILIFFLSDWIVTKCPGMRRSGPAQPWRPLVFQSTGIE